MTYYQNKVKGETINANELYIKKEWLNPSELEYEFGFSKSSQAKMRMSNNASNIPFSKIGKYIRYQRIAIEIWLQNHQVQGEV